MILLNYIFKKNAYQEYPIHQVLCSLLSLGSYNNNNGGEYTLGQIGEQVIPEVDYLLIWGRSYLLLNAIICYDILVSFVATPHPIIHRQV